MSFASASSLLPLSLLPEAAVILSPDGEVLVASPPARDMFRRDPVGLGLDELVADPDVLAVAVAELGRFDFLPQVALEGVREDGTPFAIDASVRALDGGALLCVFRELQRLHHGALDFAFDHAAVGMALFNTDGEFIRLNAAMCGLVGRPADELLGRRDQEFTHPDDRQADIDAAWRILRGDMHNFQGEKRYVLPDGEHRWVLASVTFVRDGHGRPVCWLGQFQDITELRRLASRDPLTDTLNRRAFHVELERSPVGALLMLDLDGFKDINDAHGHEAGDELLRVIAGAIARRLRRDDVLARLGGDEFAVLLPRCPLDEATRVASDLTALVAEQRFVFDGVERGVTASIGISAVEAGDVPAEALAAADRAMYSAKAVGGGRVRLHRV
ncbi:diguanylate cyclase [Solirubrobacter phytolaccae]|uniref:Diguanylate cyclase n=1 Tax=Solirubrobacter phytolaccae TaxID=1404360 RepID=A0A9X3N9P4_9ACTN|nr:sensor domain-containing diguanylate cyclase [Solirubrobacter phytolaccae]MDA0182413.1 diguanylate cyclase [Solirubrobacter phytolaccae]